MSQSALVVEVAAAESLVGHWRRRHDHVANRGMPAHITALFPFRAPAEIARGELQSLTNVAAQVARHRFALASVETFDTAIYLRPFPDDWFRQLTQRLVVAFPDCPPYGGAYPEVIPHLTVAQTSGGEAHAALLLSVEAAIASSLPIACEATALSLFISDKDGEWTLAQRFAFP